MVKNLSPFVMVVCATILHLTVSQREESRLQACGTRLANMLQAVCSSNYNTPAPEKRNSGRIQGIITFRPTDAYSYILRQKRSPGGVAAECCHRPCTYRTLRSYCMSDDD